MASKEVRLDVLIPDWQVISPTLRGQYGYAPLSASLKSIRGSRDHHEECLRRKRTKERAEKRKIA